MVSVCLASDSISQNLPSYLGFSYLRHGVSLHKCSSKVQPLLLTLNEEYLLMATPPDLGHEVAPLGPPASAHPQLLGGGVALLAASHDLGRVVAPLGCCPDLRLVVAPLTAAPDLHRWVALLDQHPSPRKLGKSSRLPPLNSDMG